MQAGRFSRRRFLASAGVTVTLPMLPSLMWSRRASAATCTPIKRFLAYHYPNGNNMPDMAPTGSGAGDAWKLPTALAAFEDIKSDILFVGGLENQQRRREIGDHAIGCGSLLTARKPTANMQVTNMSVDQAIADSLMGCRGMASFQLGTHNQGPTDSFGTYYTRSISWRGSSVANADGTMTFDTGPATPLGKEIDAKKAFDKLFQGTDPNASAADAAMRLAMRKSVLDSVMPHQTVLMSRLNATDRTKVDQLFTGIRELESSLQATSTPTGGACTPPATPGTGLDFQKQLDTMHTLMAIAFQCDVTRVISFMMGDALNNRNLSFIADVAAIGGDAGDHSVSHHAGQADLLAKFKAMCLWKNEQMAAFIRKLKSLQDADGQSVLANTLVLMCSELADGNLHNHDNIPLILAGQLAGLVTTDRYVKFPTSRDYTMVKTFGDFYITLMSLFDLKVTAFGNDGKEAIVWNH